MMPAFRTEFFPSEPEGDQKILAALKFKQSKNETSPSGENLNGEN
ncbi:unnamed protein product, partial [marine sediment metagenome]